MDEEYLKEITIAAIENGLIDKYVDNEKTAIGIGKFINTLRNECNK
ncbi:hypothetical protein LGL55_10545 [Clostridium tagluense]|nr:hypothetical protein [Clostridium tagluense]MCB2311622.1 hypothetical protein [Clostridium tagluense]MCB2316346.1 hypothetical protein [Clostridium tagluense]MCB2321270.1 hypothetical protein [Clostridium tagluense]MCB2326215.1 hypothetical protein [Clostridium tagluense]MCB2331006.1 hypothetical protein [Clostridium tagluense]